MMASTHALWGLAVATLTLGVAPEHAPVALAAGLIGGAIPDLDLYAGHRKTLHFPVYYSLAALPAAGLAIVVAHPTATAIAVFFAAAALHSVMDIFGGGLELRPWEGTSNRAVFDHRRNVWLAPRRWIRYDGAPEDLAMAAVMAVPLLAVLDGIWPTVVTGLVAVSIGYAVLRKLLVEAAERFVRWLPIEVIHYVPDRFLEGFEAGADPGPVH